MSEKTRKGAQLKSDVFPPVPKWQPTIVQPLEEIIDRVAHYTNRKRDFAVFRHGTCVILPENELFEDQAAVVAKDVLDKIYNYHPDMDPKAMKDGNIAILYNLPAINVVLSSIVEAHWEVIDRRHLDALATSEVLITSLGQNKFDDLGKVALFGRCFMFMDAQRPEVVSVFRAVTR